MGRSDSPRREHSNRSPVTQALQIFEYLVETEGQMSGDVLAKSKSWPDLINDSPDVGPQMSRIALTASLAGEAEWLARVACSDDIHDSTPRSAVEGSEITVNRSGLEATVFHAPRERGSGVGFPLHKTDGAVSGHREGNPEVEPSNPGT